MIRLEYKKIRKIGKKSKITESFTDKERIKMEEEGLSQKDFEVGFPGDPIRDHKGLYWIEMLDFRIFLCV